MVNSNKKSPQLPKQLKKASALGFETRNVNAHWLKPVLGGESNQGEEDGGTDWGNVPSPSKTHMRASGLAAYHNPADPHWAQLSPTYGPGQSTPKELAALRVTRTLQGLGRTAIYSSNPYIDSAIETLIPEQAASPYAVSPQSMERRLNGRLPRKGSKAAAIRRAKRYVSQGAAFRPEVPFEDAVRVCNLYGDKTAMPALLLAYIFSKPGLPLHKLEHYTDVLAVQPPVIQLQAAALLLQSGYYFSAIKVVYSDLEILRATLDELKLLLDQGMAEQDLEVAAHTWAWREADRDLFLKQFRDLSIIEHYLDVRKQLRAMRAQGAVALARVEREMISKVVDDFMLQLSEDLSVQAAITDARQQQEAMDAQEQAAALAAAQAAAAEQEALRKARVEERAREVAREAAEKRKAEEEARRKRRAEKDAAAGSKAGGRSSLTASEPEAEPAPQQDDGHLPTLAEETEQQVEAGQEEQPEGVAQEQEKGAGEEEAQDAAGEPSQGEGGEEAEPSAALEAEASAQGAEEPAAMGSPKAGSALGSPKAGSKAGSTASSKAGSKAGSRAGSRAGSAVASPAPGASAAQVELPPGATSPKPSGSRQPSRTPSRQASVQGSVAGQEAAIAGSRAASRQASQAGASSPALAEDAPRSGARSPAAGSPRALSPLAGAASPKSGSRAQSPLQPPKPLSPIPGTSPKPGQSPLGSPKGGATPVPPSLHGSRQPSRLQSPALSARGATADHTPAYTPLGSRLPTAPGDERAGVEEGIADMKKQLSLTRQLTEQAAEKLRSGSLSRPITPLSTVTPRSGTPSLQELDEAMVAQALAHQQLAQAERDEILANEQAEEEKAAAEAAAGQAALDAQAKQVAAQLAAKEAEIKQLDEMRQLLSSSQSQRPPTPKDDAQLKEVEAKLKAEEAAARKMAEQKRALEHQKSLERQKFEQRLAEERKMMNEQIARTMKGFQDQLAQSVKMAAMMQAQRIMQGGTGPVQPAVAPTVALPAEVDDPPTKEEIVEYARYLGIDLEQDPELLYVAEWALTAPVPEGWTVHLDHQGHEFFHNNATNVSCYEHPMDEHYRLYYLKMRAEKTRAQARAAGLI